MLSPAMDNVLAWIELHRSADVCPICSRKHTASTSTSPPIRSLIPLPCSLCYAKFLRRRRKNCYLPSKYLALSDDLFTIPEVKSAEEDVSSSSTSINSTSLSSSPISISSSCIFSSPYGPQVSSSSVEVAPELESVPPIERQTLPPATINVPPGPNITPTFFPPSVASSPPIHSVLSQNFFPKPYISPPAAEYLETSTQGSTSGPRRPHSDDSESREEKVECDFCVLEKEIFLKDFVAHLKDVHFVVGCDKEQKYYEFRTGCNDEGFFEYGFIHSPEYIYYQGHYFLCQGCTKNGKYHGWISIIGSTTEAKKYKATVVLFSYTPIAKGFFQKKAPELRWTLPVQSFADSRQAYSYTMSWSQLRPYIQKNVKLRNGCKVKFAWSVKVTLNLIKP